MLSAIDLERLIAVKRLEIEKEKTFLGLASPDNRAEDDQHRVHAENPKRSVNFQQKRDLCAYNVPSSEEKKERDGDTGHEEEIPSDLERYIRRYLGLPVMLKAGEYSPNNPLVRGERTTGDVLLGLGEYERRRNTLRRLRQQQYREYLDQQAKKKQEAKEQAEKERREREERDREREEREREREREEREREQQERERERERWRDERRSPERRRASANTVSCGALSYNKVDTGVQVDCKTAPLSVAVQTDDADLFRLPQSPSKSQLTQAERELSPHTVVDAAERPPPWTLHQDKWKPDKQERRRSYGDFDERSSTLVRKSNRDKLTSDLRHSYMPSIFDADAIEMRNMQAEKEAAARRQFYQQELKNQIMEQQRIREERKTREKMLEAAEMRRLEEQLRMLRTAQDAEVHRHKDLDLVIKEDNKEYDKKRKELQKDIDNEQIKLIRAPLTTQPLKRLPTSRSDTGKLPYYYPLLQERNKDPPLLQERSVESAYFKERPIESTLFKEKTRENFILQDRPKDKERKPFSTNIPDDSIFSPNYDVDGYLRRNLNFKAFEYNNKDLDLESIGTKEERIVEKVQIHDLPKVKPLDRVKPIPKERKCLPQESMDSLPIPVLRHSPVTQLDRVESGSDLSEAMKKVDDKWKVPAVQKNILKSIPNDEGKNVSILTQLGSIRRQLQLEQLKLDRLTKDDAIGTDIK